MRWIRRMLAVAGMTALLCIEWCIAQDKGSVSRRAAENDTSLLLTCFRSRTDAQWQLGANGGLDSIRFYREYANDQAVCLLSNFPSVRELRIQNGDSNKVTSEGIAGLNGLTNLTILSLSCGGMLPEGTFEQVCKLEHLKELTLVSCCPPDNEYLFLTNLQKLAFLQISFCKTFRDRDLNILTNLTNLKGVVLEYDGVSAQGSNLLSTIKWITNVTIKLGH